MTWRVTPLDFRHEHIMRDHTRSAIVFCEPTARTVDDSVRRPEAQARLVIL